MNEKRGVRPELTEEEIKKCHQIVDDLVRLHRETDPALGQESENYKSEKAYQALNHVGMLSAILTEWAEAQIIGSYYQIAKSEEKWIDDATSNRHENELMWHGELPESVFINDDYLVCNRSALAAILRNTFRRYGITGWRMALSEALQALNDGQVDWVLTPTNTNLQGNAYKLSNLKYGAVNHVYKLMGEGWKKTAAQQQVAESCGTTFEAIKKWEKVVIKERDRNKVELNCLRIGAEAITLFKKSPDYDETLLRAVANKACLDNEILDETERDKKDFFLGIMLCFKLDLLHPLETLKDKLIEAGMRKAD